MTRSTDPSEAKITVYRSRRRCPKCGLVNSDNAAKCRRCGQSFANVDRGLESERAEASFRAWRLAVGLVILLIIAGAVGGAVMYKAKLDRLSTYSDHARAVETDLVTIRRGAEADAARISGAFDDAEVRRLLENQRAAWEDRVQQCAGLASQVDELVPQSEEQTAHELELERDLSTIANGSRGLANAAKSSDVFAARIEAAKLVKPST